MSAEMGSVWASTSPTLLRPSRSSSWRSSGMRGLVPLRCSTRSGSPSPSVSAMHASVPNTRSSQSLSRSPSVSVSALQPVMMLTFSPVGGELGPEPHAQLDAVADPVAVAVHQGGIGAEGDLVVVGDAVSVGVDEHLAVARERVAVHRDHPLEDQRPLQRGVVEGRQGPLERIRRRLDQLGAARAGDGGGLVPGDDVGGRRARRPAAP